MALPLLPRKLVNSLHGFCASQAMFAACELGIFNALRDARAPQSAKTLATQLSTDENATSRLLDVLANIELVAKHTGLDAPLYSNTKEAAWLTDSSPMNIKGLTTLWMKVMYPLMGNLTDAVREGNSQWQRTFNESSEETFKCLYADEEKKIQFLEAMRGISRPGARSCISAFDLSRFKAMCDLGGGTGDVAYAACTVYPEMKIKILELPAVAQCSSHFRPSTEECPNQQNVTFVEGDFFTGTLPPADLYVMTRILHDWGDDKIDVILKKVFESLPSGGGILIGELLLNDDKSGPFFNLTYDLVMLVICGEGARERSGLEYKQLLEKHGFAHVQYKVTGSNSLDAVFAIKP